MKCDIAASIMHKMRTKKLLPNDSFVFRSAAILHKAIICLLIELVYQEKKHKKVLPFSSDEDELSHP